MELDKNVSNPMLVGAMQLFKADPSPEHQRMFLDELEKATFISPVIVVPEPEVDEDGKAILKQGAAMRFPMLNGSDGKRFFVAYTDQGSLDLANSDDACATPEPFTKHTATLSFADYAKMLLVKDDNGNSSGCFGIVINPTGENIIVSRDAAVAYINRAVAREQSQALAKAHALGQDRKPAGNPDAQ